jgi:EpsI family protein
MRMATLSVCFVAAALALQRATHAEQVPIRAPLSTFPTQVAGWNGRSTNIDAKVVAVLGVTEYLSRVYLTGRTEVGLYVGYYQSQRQGESIHSPLNCLPGAGWQPVSSGRLTIPVATRISPAEDTVAASPAPIEVNRYVVQKGLNKVLVLYWYQSHGRVIASEYWGKFYMVADAVRMNRTDAALVRVVVPMIGSGTSAEGSADTAGVAFVQSIFPLLQRHLPS